MPKMIVHAPARMFGEALPASPFIRSAVWLYSAGYAPDAAFTGEQPASLPVVTLQIHVLAGGQSRSTIESPPILHDRSSRIFIHSSYDARMPVAIDLSAQADLVATIYAPWRATVGECLKRWEALGPTERLQSYLVLRGEAGARRTLNATAIAELNGGDHRQTS